MWIVYLLQVPSGIENCASRDVTRTINLDILKVIREHDYYEL